MVRGEEDGGYLSLIQVTNERQVVGPGLLPLYPQSQLTYNVPSVQGPLSQVL